MKIVIAPDSLKESLSAAEAARAIERGVLAACPSAETVRVPVADGGEGTTEALVKATGGEFRTARVTGPLRRPVEARWGVLGDGRTAVIEMAQASGLELLRPDERDPMRTTTRGTGELIRCALKEGVDRLIIGIGGSATVDGGTGMGRALGVRFLAAGGREIAECCGGRLGDIERIELDGRERRVGEAEFVVASDVTNPLTGPDGAARVYGPQKGATPPEVEELEAGLENLARVIEECLGEGVAELPGAGAAGGLGAGLVAFCGAKLQSGVKTVIEAVHLRERIDGADLVITAEGRLDRQSAFGKATAGVVEAARDGGKPAIALAGALGEGYGELREAGLTAAFCVADRPMDLDTAMERAAEMLERSAEEVVRTYLAATGGAIG
jgi:glycerate kinase